MPRESENAASHSLSRLAAHALANARGFGLETLSPEQIAENLHKTRVAHPQLSKPIDLSLLEDLHRKEAALREADSRLAKAAEFIDKCAQAPLHAAIYLGMEETSVGPMAVVSTRGGHRAVAVAETIELDDLLKGERVYLSSDESMVIDRCESRLFKPEHIVTLDRITDNGTLIVQGNGEERYVADTAASLEGVELQPGESLTYDTASRLCFARVENNTRSEFLLKEVPDTGLEGIGGQQANISLMMHALTASLVDPDKARQYDIPGSSAILLHGVPGCGKTLLARSCVGELYRRFGKRVRFGLVKAGEWESPYVGVTQARIREVFKSLRKAAAEGPAVLYIDEIDAVGRHRGEETGGIGDKFLAALLAEMDGFASLENVAVIGSTNRLDMLDSALTSRFGTRIRVERPNLQSAREILAIHIGGQLPFHPNGAQASATRSTIIDSAISRLYAPNAGTEVARLKMRDGRVRSVRASDIVSGRLLQQLAVEARRIAYWRDVEGGTPGIREEDIVCAIETAIKAAAEMLTPYNAHHYIEDLGDNEVVVSVEATVSRDTAAHFVAAA